MYTIEGAKDNYSDIIFVVLAASRILYDLVEIAEIVSI